ncbi:hypothetical protein BS17DRAFT_771155, partial [Gyrodon lividus]
IAEWIDLMKVRGQMRRMLSPGSFPEFPDCPECGESGVWQEFLRGVGVVRNFGFSSCAAPLYEFCSLISEWRVRD